MKSFSLKGDNGKLYYGWVIVLVAAIITGFVYSAIVSVTGIFMLPVTGELGLSVAKYSLYLTIMSIAGIITQVIIPKYYNEKTIKKIMAIAGIFGIISFIGFAYAKSLMLFYIFAVPQGFCFAAMTMTPCQLLVSNWFGEKAKGRAMSFFLTGMTLVYLLEFNILTPIVVKMGWRAGYWFLAICVALGIIAVLTLIKWSPETAGVKRMGELDDSELSEMRLGLSKGIDFSIAIKKPLTWALLLSCALAVIASSSILQHGIPTMIIGGYTPEKATAIISALSTIMLVTGPIIGILCDKLPLKVATVGSALCFAGSCVGLSIMATSMNIGVIVYGALYIFGVASINIISPLVMSYMYGEKDMPRLFGYINMAIGIGGAFGAAGMGFMFEKFGSYQAPWLIMGGILLLVAVIRAFCTAKKNKFQEAEVEASK